MTIAKTDVNGRIVSSNLKMDTIGSIMPEKLCYETWIENLSSSPWAVCYSFAEAKNNHAQAILLAEQL